MEDNQFILNERTFSFGTIPAIEAISVEIAVAQVIGEPLFKAFTETKTGSKDLTEESNRLSPSDPTPQTIFRSKIKSGNPHPCVQTLLPETQVMAESGGVQDTYLSFVARIQSSVRPRL